MVNARFLFGVSLVCGGIGMLYYNDEDNYWVFYTFVTLAGLVAFAATAMYMPKMGRRKTTSYDTFLNKYNATEDESLSALFLDDHQTFLDDNRLPNEPLPLETLEAAYQAYKDNKAQWKYDDTVFEKYATAMFMKKHGLQSGDKDIRNFEELPQGKQIQWIQANWKR